MSYIRDQAGAQPVTSLLSHDLPIPTLNHTVGKKKKKSPVSQLVGNGVPQIIFTNHMPREMGYNHVD